MLSQSPSRGVHVEREGLLDDDDAAKESDFVDNRSAPGGWRRMIGDNSSHGLWHLPNRLWKTATSYSLSDNLQLLRRVRTKALATPKRIALLLLSLLVIVLFLRWTPRAPPSEVLQSGITMVKPADFKIIGLLFFGRRSTVEILECYLRNNLVSHGGFLDEIHFAINTHNEDDLMWLDEIVSQVKDYKRIDIDDGDGIQDFNRIYAQSIERDRMYIKLDDDLVWISPNAIPELVYTLTTHPEAFAVLSSLVNSATMGWVQYRLGAVHSYLPERKPPMKTLSDSYGPKAWRASALPKWQPPGDSSEVEEFPDTEKASISDMAPVGGKGGAPYMNHRWLPLRDDDQHIAKTPIASTEYAPTGLSWTRWAIGAQQHYSLFENIEKDQLHKYHVGEDGIWNMRYDRTNINLLAIWANDILDNLPFEGADDEQLISSNLPRKQHRQNLVQTRALAAHFSFAVQHEMYDTDLLSRYRAYANEMICGVKNQIQIRANASIMRGVPGRD